VQWRLHPDARAYKALAWTYRLLHDPVRTCRSTVMVVRKDSRFPAEELQSASLLPTHLLDAVVEHWHPHSFLDVGCGTGQAVKYLVVKGVDCIGIEGSRTVIDASPVPDRIRCLNLNRPVSLGRMFDVVWSYEVAEHIHPKYTEAFLQTLTSHGPVVVMSAAQRGQGGYGHFNEQPPQYWIERLERRGFSYLADVSRHFQSLPDDYARNVMAFLHQGTKS
jgi:cyclopropane fatty-acyl-phospholipid synthase-like methyltransferase